MDPITGAGLGSRTALDGLAVGAAVVLLGLAFAVLPRDAKGRIRVAAVYLAVALVAEALGLVVDDPGAQRLILFFFYFFVLASSGRSLVVLAVDGLFGRRTHRAPPRIFRDLTQGVVYVVVLLLTLRAVGVEPGSLLTTSALLTAVIGLAMQDTIGNLVSGLALQMQRPFEVGDWIQFDPDPKQIGKVTEVNWRATTVMTNDLVEVIVPNAHLAKALIRNYSRPSTLCRSTVSVRAPVSAPPRRVQEALLRGLVGVPGVLSDPPPWVQTRAFGENGVEYHVFFFIDDFATRERTDGLVRDRLWYGLQRAGLAIPLPVRVVQLHDVSEESEKKEEQRELDRRDRVLRCVDFLGVLPPDVHRALAARTAKRLYAPGEAIVRQGERSSELFVIDRGEVAIEVARDDGKVENVARLGAGKFFGEMALMTGEARAATVRALEECELLVIDHGAFQGTLASVPGVVDQISGVLAARQAELEAVTSRRASVHEPVDDRSKRLISQIKGFFKL